MEGGCGCGLGDMGRAVSSSITGPQKHLIQLGVPNVHEIIYLVLIWC